MHKMPGKIHKGPTPNEKSGGVKRIKMETDAYAKHEKKNQIYSLIWKNQEKNETMSWSVGVICLHLLTSG